MELTISIKERSKIAEFLNLIKKMDHIDIVSAKEDADELPEAHKDLLDKRMQKIENGNATFKKWDLIKKEYEEK